MQKAEQTIFMIGPEFNPPMAEITLQKSFEHKRSSVPLKLNGVIRFVLRTPTWVAKGTVKTLYF